MALLCTFGFVTRLTGRPSAGLFATAWLGWTPGFILATARFNNDAAAIGWSALTLLICLRFLLRPGEVRWRGLVGLSLTLAAALLSKLASTFLVPLVGAVAVLVVPPGAATGSSWTRRGVASCAGLALPLGLAGGWWLTYGQLFARGFGSQVGLNVLGIWELASETAWVRLVEATWWLNTTWLGRPGFDAEVGWSPAIYAFYSLPSACLFAAGVRALAQPRWWPTCQGPARKATILLSASVVPLVYATLARQAFPSVALDANARFLLLGAPVIAL